MCDKTNVASCENNAFLQVVAGNPAIFLQPHPDDGALSCGGIASLISSTGGISHIVSVFAGEIVPAMVGRFAAMKHERWNIFNPQTIIETRRKEDENAAKILGCSLRWLGMPDAIYRGDSISSDEELYGCLKYDDILIAEHLVKELTGLPEWNKKANVFVPLAVGSHVDHQIIYEVGRRLSEDGHVVYAWEDMPYAIHSPHKLIERMKLVGCDLRGVCNIDISTYLERRLAAIECYKSQVSTIFRFTNDFRAAVTDYVAADRKLTI